MRRRQRIPSIASPLFPLESAAYRKACELASAEPQQCARHRLPRHRAPVRARDGLDTARMSARRRPRRRRHRRGSRQGGFQSRERTRSQLNSDGTILRRRRKNKARSAAGLAMLGYGNRVGRKPACTTISLRKRSSDRWREQGRDRWRRHARARQRIADDIRERVVAKTGHRLPMRSWFARRTRIRARLQHLRDSASRRETSRRPRPRMGTRVAGEDRVRDSSRQRKTRTCNTARRQRAVHSRNQPPPETSWRHRFKPPQIYRGLADARSPAHSAYRPNSEADCIRHELSVPRRRAVRG